MAPGVPSQDYYVILEVCVSATYEEIKASYRRLALLHHPDKNKGSKVATNKIQLINAAWDVLKDDSERCKYDRQRSNFKPPSAGPSNPPTTPQSSWQAPRPSTTTAQDDAKAQAASQKKRQEWLDFERFQEEQIRQSQRKVKEMDAGIAALNAKISENRTKLANDVPYWWNPFASLAARLSEEEKNSLRRHCLDCESAIRIKQIPLDKEKVRLDQLKAELSRRREEENKRAEAERYERARRERLAREKAQAEAQRRVREEWERQRAAQEERDRQAREEAAAAAAIRRQKMEQERVAREARMKQTEQERIAREALMRKLAEECAQRQKEQRAKQQQAKTSKARTTDIPKHTAGSTCKHRGWWIKVEGRHDCAHCTRPLYKFAEQCPGCGTTACASCRAMLKRGITPPIDNSHGRNREHARSTEGKRGGRHSGHQ